MKRIRYIVGGHAFTVEAESCLFEKMRQYQPFINEGEEHILNVFTITLIEIIGELDIKYVKESQWENDSLSSVCGHTTDGKMIFSYQWQHQPMVTLVVSNNYKRGVAYLTGHELKLGIDMAMMVIYSHATAQFMTAIIHASTICYQKQAFLFVGLSGTGKSTHSRLWLEHVPGTELINDDKPVIRILDNNEVRGYGSPWSGKTHCYRNVSYPVSAIVKLHQASCNRIRRLNHIEAYVILLHCIYGKRWDILIGDSLHQIENSLIARLPIWELECLPDKDACLLCKETITK